MAAAKNIYTLIDPRESDPMLIDSLWAGAEAIRHAVMSALTDSAVGYLDAHIWAQAIPVIAQFFTRGIDFRERFIGRWPPDLLPIAGHPDNVNFARAFESHRLYSAIMRAEWEIAHVPPSKTLVANDLGRGVVSDPSTGRYGYVIPIDIATALILTKGPKRPELYSTPEDAWMVAPIRHRYLASASVDDLNHALAAQARREVYGSDPSVVARVHAGMGSTSPSPQLAEPHLLTDLPRLSREREVAYGAFLSLIGKPPSEQIKRRAQQGARPSGTREPR